MNENLEELKGLLSSIGRNRKKTIASEITELLRDAILDGTLPEGFVFPNENDMCKALNIGRSSMRECYSSLQILNLITRTKNGTVVNPLTDTHTMINFDTIVDKSTFDDVMEFRGIVETGIIYNAALHCTEDDIATLHEILKKQEATHDVEQLTEIDYDFHSALAEASKNQLLFVALNSVRSKFEEVSHTVFTTNPDYNLNEHKKIVKALEQHDIKLAKRAMREHLRSISRYFPKES